MVGALSSQLFAIMIFGCVHTATRLHKLAECAVRVHPLVFCNRPIVMRGPCVQCYCTAVLCCSIPGRSIYLAVPYVVGVWLSKHLCIQCLLVWEPCAWQGYRLYVSTQVCCIFVSIPSCDDRCDCQQCWCSACVSMRCKLMRKNERLVLTYVNYLYYAWHTESLLGQWAFQGGRWGGGGGYKAMDLGGCTWID